MIKRINIEMKTNWLTLANIELITGGFNIRIDHSIS